MMEFQPFPKIARLSRNIIITEKLDGTNAQVCITEDGKVFTGSRKRWITPEDDNLGFATWVQENLDEIITLGPGRHFGEWWGHGIQRGYGLAERRFSLFNVNRWCLSGFEPKEGQRTLPSCCDLVPVLYMGSFNTLNISRCIDYLHEHGSVAAPGFMKPEGIMVYHTAANIVFKKTLENDDKPKGMK